jgi:cytidylate kinase
MGITITLSRQLGSGGAEIACGVAAELGLRVVGRGLVHEALEGCVLDDTGLEAEEEKPAFIRQALDFLQGKPPIPASHTVLNRSEPGVLSTRLFNSDQYYRSILESIVFDLTQLGDVLIIGQAGQLILREDPNALHVRVVAPLDKRVRVIQARFDVSQEEARGRIRASDKARADYLKRHYREDIDDAKLYDLTLNTGTVPEDAAIKLTVDAVKAAGLLISPDA